MVGGAHRSQSRQRVFVATSAPMCLDITSLKGQWWSWRWRGGTLHLGAMKRIRKTTAPGVSVAEFWDLEPNRFMVVWHRPAPKHFRTLLVFSDAHFVFKPFCVRQIKALLSEEELWLSKNSVLLFHLLIFTCIMHVKMTNPRKKKAHLHRWMEDFNSLRSFRRTSEETQNKK